MSTPATPFQEFLSEWVVDMNKLLEETETWYADMLDQNPNYNFEGTPMTTLKNLRSTFISDLETLQAEL